MSLIPLATFYQSLTPDLEVAQDFAVTYGQNPVGAATPAPSFTAAIDSTVTTSALAPLTVQFTDTSTTPASTTITGWLWNFGDSGTSTVQNPSHVYLTEGTHDVTLTVTNANGSATQIQSGIIVVTGMQQVPVTQVVGGLPNPVTAFTTSVTSGAHPLTVTFTDTSTNTPYEWLWDFGDGGKSTLENPVYVYGHAGTFSVTLSATNAGGSRIATSTITVS